MNPWLSLLLLALGAIGIILVVALISSVVLLATGKRYALKEYARMKNQIAQLLGGDEALAERLLEGEELPEDCPNREEIAPILDAYRAQQERIRSTSEELQTKRSQKRRVLKFLMEKKDKGEWI